MRDSDLIRKLLKSGLSYRAVSSIANCSHGSVSAEVACMKKEAAQLKINSAKQAEQENRVELAGPIFPIIPSIQTKA